MSRAKLWAPRAALLALLAYLAAWNLAFIQIDTRPPNNNELNHILPSVDMWLWSTTRPGVFSAYLQSFSGYPPITLLASLAYYVWGPSYGTGMIVQTFFYMLWIVGIYMFCAHAFSRWTGVLAALVLGTFPSVIDVSRQFLLEIPLGAFSAWAAYALLKSRGFQDKRWSLAAGIFIGLSMLSKQTFFVYAGGPALAALCWMAVSGLRHRSDVQRTKSRRRPWMPWLVLIALVWAFSILIYYGPSGKHREALNITFQQFDTRGIDPALAFLVLTGVLGTALVLLLRAKTGGLRNLLVAALSLTLVASIWYFPKGIGSLLGYIGQMQANVGAAESVNLEVLAGFYGTYLGQYYFGFTKGWLTLLLAGLLLAVLLASLVPKSGVRLHGSDETPWIWLTIILWLLIPVLTFLVLPIQNEMNLVPVMGPSAALVAGLVFQWRPLAGAGGRPGGAARATVFAGKIITAIIVLLLLASSLLFPTFFKRPDGTYRPLPIECGQERDHLALIRGLSPGSWRGAQPAEVRLKSFLVRKAFYLKFPDFRYFIPFEEDWQLGRLAGLLERAGLAQKPILLPEQGFYFSFNALAFTLSCAGRHAEVHGGFMDPAPTEGRTLEQAMSQLRRFDAVIVRESLPANETEASDEGGLGSDRDMTLKAIRSGDESIGRNFRFVNRLPLPEGTSILVYFRK